jgi:hypothetical protein
MDRPLRTLLVTSPGPIEGKSIAVANLVGVVLNAVPTHKGRYYYYSYHETYGDGRGRRKHRRRRLFGRRRRAD